MRHKGSLFITLGLLLIAAALLLTGYNLYDQSRAADSARQTTQTLQTLLPQREPETPAPAPETPEAPQVPEPEAPEEVEIPDYILNPDKKMPTETVDGVEYIGILSLPSLELELPIISQWSYPSLKKAPCRYNGSVYRDNLILAGHNYTSHFGKLRKLHTGDSVIFTDMEGNVFRFSVAALEVLQSTDLEGMESGGWPLTLFTCTTGGQSRVTVRCQREDMP